MIDGAVSIQKKHQKRLVIVRLMMGTNLNNFMFANGCKYNQCLHQSLIETRQ